ncbi:hypothetical protein DFA_04207 [Cavenderia fasciculata]|uniref:Longin domain-containing protein n=1 Tax=Cavenderia fasciculata TaxID=261658 RepID=F4Q1L0_CACFS|nr:uncharacterized protein DFA_04207 [Cavenderia fasciculata]EGG18711.1 hypothetical protein DFA_04207 [Cavenderia fasciculata]|eukprot:XP_004366615.1 hypothetical protein DFA_04207 [Cavenderia fasciculata]
MVLFAMLCRISDGLMLSESMDSGPESFDQYKQQAKTIFSKLSRVSEKEMTFETDKYYFAYLIENDVCYLTFCERSYPKKMAFNFLEEIYKEFDTCYGSEVAIAKRPYQFVKFESFITKTKKLYKDSRTQRNLSDVSYELRDVHRIMSKNIQDIIGRGEKLSDVNQKSEMLLAESVKYEKQTLDLASKLFLKKYGPLLIVLLFVLIFSSNNSSNNDVDDTRIKIRIGDKADLSKKFEMKDVKMFVEVSGDANPVHTDPVYASTTRFKKPIIHGMLVASVLSALVGTKLPELNFIKPAYVGDTIRAEVTIMEGSRSSKILLDTKCIAVCHQTGKETTVITGPAIIYHPNVDIVIDK